MSTIAPAKGKTDDRCQKIIPLVQIESAAIATRTPIAKTSPIVIGNSKVLGIFKLLMTIDLSKTHLRSMSLRLDRGIEITEPLTLHSFTFSP